MKLSIELNILVALLSLTQGSLSFDIFKTFQDQMMGSENNPMDQMMKTMQQMMGGENNPMAKFLQVWQDNCPIVQMLKKAEKTMGDENNPMAKMFKQADELLKMEDFGKQVQTMVNNMVEESSGQMNEGMQQMKTMFDSMLQQGATSDQYTAVLDQMKEMSGL